MLISHASYSTQKLPWAAFKVGENHYNPLQAAFHLGKYLGSTDYFFNIIMSLWSKYNKPNVLDFSLSTNKPRLKQPYTH